MTSALGTKVIQFVSDNQPLTRKQILNEFYAYAPNTVYRIINQLINQRRLALNRDREIIIEGTEYLNKELKTFSLPSQLPNFENLTVITNAYVNMDKSLQDLSEILTQDEEMRNKFLALLIDLTIIRQFIVDGTFSLSANFAEKRPLNKEYTKERVKEILAAIAQTQYLTDKA